ncbi:hypothetical protein ACFLS1_12040, partial [Verrucomicrobiota bacterium]
KELWRTEQKYLDANDPLIYHEGTLLAAGRGMLHAFSPEDGKKLWEAPFRAIGHLDVPEVFCIGDTIWVGAKAEKEIAALDIKTGKEKRRISIQKHVTRTIIVVIPTEARQNILLKVCVRLNLRIMRPEN